MARTLFHWVFVVGSGSVPGSGSVLGSVVGFGSAVGSGSDSVVESDFGFVAGTDFESADGAVPGNPADPSDHSRLVAAVVVGGSVSAATAGPLDAPGKAEPSPALVAVIGSVLVLERRSSHFQEVRLLIAMHGLSPLHTGSQPFRVRSRLDSPSPPIQRPAGWQILVPG